MHESIRRTSSCTGSLPRWLGAAATILMLGAAGLSPAWAQPAPTNVQRSDQPRRWAVLIGVERYRLANPLRHTVNDVRQIAETLRTRGGFERDCIIEVTDKGLSPRFQPLRASLLAELPKWLQLVSPKDEILVYFSGHGVRDKAGRLYLAPIDCDPQNPATTGVDVEWLREQIAACPASFKLLVLDACHAGSEKGTDDNQAVTAKEIGDHFEDLDKVLTLASSSANELSQIWEDKQQSLFSYWLNQGLRGHADRDGNGAVDVDELYSFVSRSVKQTAARHFPRGQNPRRIVRAGIDGVPVVVQLQPQSLKQVLGDIAEQLAVAIEEHSIGRVGVLEFTNDTRLGELLGADFGLLGRYCSEEFERRLMDAGSGRFNVIDRRRLQTALREQRFTVDDLGSPAALRAPASKSGGLPVIATGTLRNRAGRVVTLQCKLVRTESDDLAGAAGGAAALSEAEWAMLGRSVGVRPEDRPPPAPPPQRRRSTG